METDAERLTETESDRSESQPARSAWELIDEEWEGRNDAPMCM